MNWEQDLITPEIPPTAGMATALSFLNLNKLLQYTVYTIRYTTNNKHFLSNFQPPTYLVFYICAD